MKFLTFLLLAAIALGSAFLSRSCCDCENTVETALADSASTTLSDDQSNSGISAEVDDFGVTLKGTVPTEEARTNAANLVAENLPAGNIINQIEVASPSVAAVEPKTNTAAKVAVGAAAAAAVAIAAPAAEVPEKIVSIEIEAPESFDNGAALNAISAKVGDPVTPELAKEIEADLLKLDAVDQATVAINEANQFVAKITPAAAKPAPAPRPLISSVTIEADDSLDSEEIAKTLGLKKGDDLTGIDLQEIETKLGALPGVKTATLRKNQTENGIGLVANLIAKPAEPKIATVEVDAPEGIAPAALSEAIRLKSGEPYKREELAKAEARLSALPGVDSAKVSAEKVGNDYKVSVALTESKPEPAPEPTPAPEPAPEPVIAEKPAPKPEAAPAAPAILKPEPKNNGSLASVLSNSPIYFRPTHVCVDSSEMDRLRAAVKAILAAGDNTPLEIVGYSDSQGSADHKEWIGYRRAAEVRNFLIDMGVKRANISTISGGVGSGNTLDEQRRAEIRIAR